MKQIPVDTYSRVVGYFQPTRQWNKGKKQEFSERVTFDIKKIKKAIEIKNTCPE
jgi:hypothetical protein